MNSVQVIGNLTRDIELKYTQSGKAVGNINLAVNDGYGDKKKTLFIKAVVWEKTAEACNEYLKKGSKVAITGKLEQRSWETQDGEKKIVIEIAAQTVEFLDTKKKEESQDIDL